jgi:hypothetical protein
MFLPCFRALSALSTGVIDLSGSRNLNKTNSELILQKKKKK